MRRRQRAADAIPHGLVVGCDAAWCVDRVIRIKRNGVDIINVVRHLPEFSPDLHAAAVDVGRAVPVAQHVAAHRNFVIVFTDREHVVEQQFRAEMPVAEQK